MPVGAVGLHVLGPVDERALLARPATGARDPRLRVDHDRLDQTALGEWREREQRRGRIAARVRDQLGLTDALAGELGEAVDRVLEQVGVPVGPVPELVGRQVDEPEVGREVDDGDPEPAHRRDHRRRRPVRVGDDRRVDPLEPVEVELGELDRDPVARAQVGEARARLAARGRRRELEPRMAPDQFGGERPGIAGGAGDEHPHLTHEAVPPISPSESAIRARSSPTSASVRVRSRARNSSRSARLRSPGPTCSPR